LNYYIYIFVVYLFAVFSGWQTANFTYTMKRKMFDKQVAFYQLQHEYACSDKLKQRNKQPNVNNQRQGPKRSPTFWPRKTWK